MENKNEHNLEHTGNTIGQLYNTSKYDNKYNRKKGMRFFTVMVILVFVASIIFLMINPYSDIVIMFADDSEITVHEIKINVLGNFKFKDTIEIEYVSDDLKFNNLKGKSAQLAVLIKSLEVDLIFSDIETLLVLGKNGYTQDHSQYTGNKHSEILLRHDLFENDFDLLYGIKISSPVYIDFNGESALSITNNSGSKHNSPKEWNQLVKFINKLEEGANYIEGRF